MESKKCTLEDLSKDDLIKKCKGYLVLAQRSKSAKDEYLKENKVLQEEIIKYKKEKVVDQEKLQALTELNETLMDNKLKLTSENSIINNECKQLKLSDSKVDALEMELEGVKRQNKRLTIENDDLLASLEKQDSSENACKTCDSYLKERHFLNDKINRIKIRLRDLSAKVTKLKTSKHILLETQREYAYSVAKWQDQIINGSKQLYSYLQKAEIEKINLQKQLSEQTVFTGNSTILETIPVLVQLCEKAITDYKKLENQNIELTEKKSTINDTPDSRVLLTEMRELNEILKNRGDMISQQEQKIVNFQKQISTLQKEKSQLEDEINKLHTQDLTRDVCSVSTISKQEEVDRIKEVDESLEDKFNKMKIMAIKLKKKCQEQTEVIQKCMCEKHIKNIKALQAENDKLQDQLEILKLKPLKEVEKNDNNTEKDVNEKIIFLQQDVEKKTIQINENNLEIQKLKAAVKKSSVLSLELEAYEKSLNELSDKLKEKCNELIQVNQNLTSKGNKIECLEKQILLLEENLEGEKNHILDLKQQIDKQNLKIKSQELENQDIQAHRDSLIVDSENLRAERGDLQLNLAECVKKYESANLINSKEKEDLYLKVNVLNEQLISVNEKLTLKSKEMENINNEFVCYKIKVQNVLRQNQNKESEKEKQLEEELLEVKAEACILSENLKSVTEKYDQSLLDSERSNEELAHLQSKVCELRNLLDECRRQNEILLQDNKEQNDKLQETLKAHRIQIDSINEFYSNQIQELKQKIIEKEVRIEPSGATNIPAVNAKSTDEENIDLLLLEREDAEGSESSFRDILPKRKISQIQTRSRHDIIPLDELLNSSADVIYSNEDDFNVHSLREDLFSKSNQVVHLRSLLSETEQDLAKISQQNDLLKEEIRKNERASERISHMQNSEYLKNVVLKFLTLNNGDEKSRLVPVLNTILKLTKTENEVLEKVAQGKDSVRTWGSLLWSSN